MIPGMGHVSSEIPPKLLEFFILSSYNYGVIAIRISKGDDMARPDIKNLNDLNDYLTVLEDSIAVLEQEDRTIKGAINEVNHNLQFNNQPADLPATAFVKP
jgi:hypothetical protein